MSFIPDRERSRIADPHLLAGLAAHVGAQHEAVAEVLVLEPRDDRALVVVQVDDRAERVPEGAKRRGLSFIPESRERGGTRTA